MLWWSFAVGVAVGILLTPLTYYLAEWWWNRRWRRELRP
jgi:hypothetical protein